ncbi:BolA/IbaG family iron-sulfur metabolism protein [Buchnera aphidicola (Thelaxes californica)]|uniref:BolA/IbaG family iron-sulfur metabolism protein n=1 Tax=Buchnera aphidicola (Thelaxes californica) TaxID=1315998 RepID=A0A4D6YLH4_9GAMM|nr:BolA/IbaG family iron-sulfur metabolism protein [Buchnera aphidicola]QCI26824.1 BolA/IbaG family iron-sulfur metabolism protein [Buchnera aphidicola (Thelaxes californica)]
MKIKDIKILLKKKIPLSDIYIEGNNQHIKIIAIGDIFNNMNTMQREKTIYNILTPYIINQTIHAVSINAYSLIEWKNNYINNANKHKK